MKRLKITVPLMIIGLLRAAGAQESSDAAFVGILADAQKTARVTAESGAVSDEKILHDAVQAVYPKLADDHRRLIDQGLEFVVTRQEPLTSLAFGWGPEDDRDYRYPDRSFYPSGTIKVNISLQSIEILRLAKNGPPLVQKALSDYFYAGMVHEIEHAKQYHEAPMGYVDDPERCAKGWCQEVLIDQSRSKARYEFAAIEREFTEAKSKQGKGRYSEAARYLQDHPDLLTGRIKNLPELLASAAAETEEAVSDQKRMVYESAYRVPELGREYFTALQRGDANEAERVFHQIETYFFYNCKIGGVMTASYTYLIPVFEGVLGPVRCRPASEYVLTPSKGDF